MLLLNKNVLKRLSFTRPLILYPEHKAIIPRHQRLLHCYSVLLLLKNILRPVNGLTFNPR